ncbi:MAG: hypothetical protein P8M30_20445 [Planctomycetaceae bacterium]|nr:hypothetical protein [Planctomycetaceae bacterium]
MRSTKMRAVFKTWIAFLMAALCHSAVADDPVTTTSGVVRGTDVNIGQKT